VGRAARNLNGFKAIMYAEKITNSMAKKQWTKLIIDVKNKPLIITGKQYNFPPH